MGSKIKLPQSGFQDKINSRIKKQQPPPEHQHVRFHAPVGSTLLDNAPETMATTDGSTSFDEDQMESKRI